MSSQASQNRRSPDKRNKKERRDNKTYEAIRSPKKINNREFQKEVKKVKIMVGDLLKLAPEVAKIKNPSTQYLDFKETTFTDKDGNEITLQAQRFKESDYRAFLLELDENFKHLVQLYRNKTSRNSFKVSAFFDPKNRFEGWQEYLNAQNRLVKAGPVILQWINSENFGNMTPPSIDESFNVTGGKSNADDKAKGLINKLSPQLKRDGIAIRSIFGLLFFHAIRVATIRNMAGIEERGGHPGGTDKRQNYFTAAMKAAFVNKSAQTPYYVYDDEGKKVQYNLDDKYSTVEYLLDTKYSDDNNSVEYLNVEGESKGQSARLTDDFVHITAVQTILNINIVASLPEQENLAVYETAVEDYRLAFTAREAWKKALESASKKKAREDNRVKREKKKREASE